MLQLRERLHNIGDQLSARFAQAKINKAIDRYAAQVESDLETFLKYLRNTKNFDHSSRGRGSPEYFNAIIPNFGIARRMVVHLANAPARQDIKFSLLTAHESMIERDGRPDHNLRLRYGFNVLKQIEWMQQELRADGLEQDAGHQVLQDLKTHILKQHIKSLNEEIQNSPLRGSFSVSSMGISSASSLHTWVDNCRLYEFEDPEINAALISVFENVSMKYRDHNGAAKYVQDYIDELKAKGAKTATPAPTAQPA